MVYERFKDFHERLIQTGVATTKSILGCSDAEISTLETRYQFVLPHAYREYLSKMGHKSGRLLTHDHYAATYEWVLGMTDGCRQLRDEIRDCKMPILPADALVIVGRLGEQFMMIRCSSKEDSPVWSFNTYENEVVMTFQSVVDWLDSLIDEALSAIESGYYEIFPHGTGP